MGKTLSKPTKRDAAAIKKNTMKMDTSIPPLRDLKGPGLLATYRIAYLKKKLLLLKAMTVKEKKKKKKKGKTGDLKH